MKVYEIEDLKTKKLVREVGDRMDYIAWTYIDLLFDVGTQMYPEGLTDEQYSKLCDDLSKTFAKSLEKVFDEMEL